MEKFQSNLEIAGSLRNSFRASLEVKSHGGRALVWTRGPSSGYGIQINSECHVLILGSQTASDKIRSRKGNSPDHQLRSPNMLSGKGCGVA